MARARPAAGAHSLGPGSHQARFALRWRERGLRHGLPRARSAIENDQEYDGFCDGLGVEVVVED